MLARVLLVLLAAAALGRAEELLDAKVVALDEFPREVSRGDPLVIRGVVKGAFRQPELVIIAPGGKTYLNKDNRISEVRFEFTVRFGEGPGPYRMEILAHAPNATKSGARFTIYHGVHQPAVEPPPEPPAGPPTPRGLHPRLIEKRFVAILNRFRKDIGVGPVGWNEAVASRARIHAARMAALGVKQHSFGKMGGVKEMLAAGGADGDGRSGPPQPWRRISTTRPFPPPSVRKADPDLRDHVVTFVLFAASVEQMFDEYFEREAAFRLCAADPHCVEVAVGAARPPKEAPARTQPGRTTARDDYRRGVVYYCICFVQVNDKTLVKGQDAAYRALLRDAARAPDLMRHVGVWGRPEGRRLAERATRGRDAAMIAAGFDALLLLDEDKARDGIHRAATEAEADLARGRYADAAATAAWLRTIVQDAQVAEAGERILATARENVARERREIEKIEEATERERALAALKARAGDLLEE